MLNLLKDLRKGLLLQLSSKQAQPIVPASAKSLSHAESLHANIPSLSVFRQQQSAKSRRLKSTMGTKQIASISQSKLKASSQLQSCHIYAGNIDMMLQSFDVEEYLKDAKIKVLTCEMLHNSHVSGDYISRRALAHIMIDIMDKDKALCSAT